MKLAFSSRTIIVDAERLEFLETAACMLILGQPSQWSDPPRRPRRELSLAKHVSSRLDFRGLANELLDKHMGRQRGTDM